MKHSNNPARYLLVVTQRFPGVEPVHVASDFMYCAEAVAILAAKVREREYYPWTDHTAKVISEKEYIRITSGADE